MELNPTNEFGGLLLDLIEGQYDGDIDAGIAALIETTGLEEEEIVAIIEGSTIVEDESLLAAIVEAFPDADDEDLQVIVETATAVEEADRQELIAEIEAEEGAMEEEPMDEEYLEDEMPEEAAYSRQHQYANFQAGRLQARVNDLETQIANFQQFNALASELKDIEREAAQYVESGVLPPSYKSMLIGNFSDDSQRVARFSQVAEGNGVDLSHMLFATRYALEMLKNASHVVAFTDFSQSDEDIATANFNASLDAVVAEDLKAIFDS